MKRVLSAWVAALAWLLAACSAVAGDSYVLSLPGEGTASVHISRADKTAYLTDGGKSGSEGAAGIKIDGRPLLEFLQGEGVENVVITCSHPHSDHLDGLVTIITKDPFMARFKSVGFIDSGFGSAKNAPVSLETLYRGAAKKNAWDITRQSIATAHAENKDAFAEIRDKLRILEGEGTSRVKSSNFIYEARAKASEHGNSVISTYVTEGPAGTRRIVDFDDADKTLVNQWAEWAKEDPASRKPDVAIMPHHGSDLTDVTRLFDPEIRPTECVFTANDGNRFGHPGGQSLKKAVDAVGLEHVHITGAGEHIQITELGVNAGSRDLNKLANSFVLPRIERTRSLIIDLEQRSDRSPSEEKRLARLRKENEDATAVYNLINKKIDPDGFGGASRSPSGPHFPTPRPSGGGGRAGGGGGGIRFPSNPPSHVPSRSVLAPRGASATGPFLEEIIKPVRLRQAAQLEKNLVGAELRLAKFSVSRIGIPIEGGIIIGAQVTGPPQHVTDAHFILGTPTPELQVTLRYESSERKMQFKDWTRNTLACAYRFVHPTREDIAAFGVEEGDCSLLSITKNHGTSWSFAMHPAIADTPLALDGMRLDMSLAAIPELAEDANYTTYQWYDSRTKVVASNGALIVVPAEGDSKSLLRLRLWARPEWASRENIQEGFVTEAAKRLALLPNGQSLLNSNSFKILKTIRSVELPSEAEVADLDPESFRKQLLQRSEAALALKGLDKSAEYRASEFAPSLFKAILMETQSKPPPDWLLTRTSEIAQKMLTEERPLPFARKNLKQSKDERLKNLLTRRGSEILEEVLFGELGARLRKQLAASGGSDADVVATQVALFRATFRSHAEPDKLSEAFKKAGATANLTDKSPFAVKLVEMELENELKGHEVDGAAVAARVRGRLDAAGGIERLMKAVAILSWLKDQGHLPELPPGIEAEYVRVDPELSVDEVEP